MGFSKKTYIYVHPEFVYVSATQKRIFDVSQETISQKLLEADLTDAAKTSCTVYLDPAICYSCDSTFPTTLKHTVSSLLYADIQDQLSYLKTKLVSCSVEHESEDSLHLSTYLLTEDELNEVQQTLRSLHFKKFQIVLGFFTSAPIVKTQMFRFQYKKAAYVYNGTSRCITDTSSITEISDVSSFCELLEQTFKAKAKVFQPLTSHSNTTASSKRFLLSCICLLLLNLGLAVGLHSFEAKELEKLQKLRYNAFQQLLPGVPIIDLEQQLNAVSRETTTQLSKILHVFQHISEVFHPSGANVLTSISFSETVLVFNFQFSNYTQSHLFENALKNSSFFRDSYVIQSSSLDVKKHVRLALQIDISSLGSL